jgi:hypothetical protein
LAAKVNSHIIGVGVARVLKRESLNCVRARRRRTKTAGNENRGAGRRTRNSVQRQCGLPFLGRAVAPQPQAVADGNFRFTSNPAGLYGTGLVNVGYHNALS